MVKNSQNLNKKVPKLRFPGFSGVWEEKKLGDICDVKGGKRIPLGYSLQLEKSDFPYITVSDMENGSISSEKIKYVPEQVIKQIKNYTISTKDIYISVAGTLGLVGVIPQELDGANLTENADKLTNLKCDQSFLLNYLRGGSLKKLIENTKTSNAQPKLAIYSLNSLKLYLPDLLEQKKIADFFGNADEWIENLRAQKESLESYKKGMMQKIFSQQIRFKDDNSKDLPEWEEKTLRDLGKTYNGLVGKSAVDFGEGEPFITYKQIFDCSEINVNNFGFVKVSQDEKQNKASFGDVFFTTSSETPNEVGFASVLLNNEVNPYLNSFSFGYRLNENLDSNFAKFLFRNYVYRREIVKLAQGSTRYNISKLEFLKIKLKIPGLLEQQKIAEFLIYLDKLIKLKQQQISDVEQWKNGLMQELFV